MSEYYLKSDNAQSSQSFFFSSLPAERKTQASWYPRGYTEWSPEIQNALLHFFTKCDYPFRHILVIPFQEPLRSEIRRFFISLDAYIDSPNPVIPYKDLLYGATMKDYAETLKRIRRKAFETTWAVDHFDYPDWWNDVPTFRIKEIGDIFNYSYLIHWKSDDEKDYLNGFIPVKITNETISNYKDYLRDILPERESFEKISEVEVLSQLSSSMSLKPGTFEHVPHYKLKPKHLRFSKKRGVSERVLIEVSPNNCRDSVLNNPSDLNTISLMDCQLMEILRRMPQHIHLKDKDEVSRRILRLHKKFRFFLQRDIKKEGITKPRELLKATLEVLHELYPDIEIFGHTSFYDEYLLRVNGEILRPLRGHGLGMANCMTTLMNLVIHQWIVDELLDDIPELRSECLTLNDDFVVGFKDEYHLEAYWDKEDEIMELLSIIREPKKSFSSELKFVIAERYITPEGEYEKVSYQLRELLLPLACANVVHAKESFIAAQTYVNSSLVQRYIEDIKAYWGYEFFPEEFNYPSKVGGWINPKYFHVDLTMKMLEELEYNTRICRGANAVKTSLPERTGGNISLPPILTLLGNPRYPKKYRRILNVISEDALNDKFGKLLSRSSWYYDKYWNDLFIARQKVYKKPYDIDFMRLLSDLVTDYPETQFLPSESMIRRFHPVDIYQARIDDIYLDPNPVMSMLNLYNDFNYPFKEEFSINFTDKEFFSKKITGLFSKEIQRTLKSELLSNFFTGKYAEVYIPKQDFHPEEMYLNPIHIGIASANVYWGLGYPELKPQFKSPLIESKRAVFNRLFSIKEQILLSDSKLNRACIKKIADYMTKTGDSLESILDYLGKEVAKTIKPKPPPEKQEEEEDFELNDQPRPLADGEVHIITFADMISESSYFYLWRNNPEEYPPENETVDRLLRNLRIIETYGTFPGLCSPEERARIKQQIQDRVYIDRIFCIIAERSGVVRLLDPSVQDDVLDSEEGFLDFFGNDD